MPNQYRAHTIRFQRSPNLRELCHKARALIDSSDWRDRVVFMLSLRLPPVSTEIAAPDG